MANGPTFSVAGGPNDPNLIQNARANKSLNEINRIEGLFSQFGNLDPGLQQVIRKGLFAAQPTRDRGFTELGASAIGGLQRNLGAFSATGLPIGLSTLNQILLSQGRTDPRAFNLQRQRALAGAEASTQATQQDLARAGLQRSGVGQAIAAAQRGAGQSAVRQIDATEAQLAESRKRSDLGLLLNLLIGPQLQIGNIGANLRAAELGVPREPSSGEEFLALLGNVGAPLLGNPSLF